MSTVTCPTCGEKGKIPPSMIGSRIKCKKCATSFVVSPPASKAGAAVSAAAGAVSGLPSQASKTVKDGIEVDGLDETAWAYPSVVAAEAESPHEEAQAHADESASAFTAHPDGHAVKHYKLLTPKDKFFNNQFSIERLEEALNHYSRSGWVVRGMATPHVAGFSGGEREQLIILLER